MAADHPEDSRDGAVLVDHEIQSLVESKELITDFKERQLKGASYDMRLGTEFATSDEHGVLTPENPCFKLEPGQFILLTSHEWLALPTDLAGHAGLIGGWAQQGLISLFSPQIDPGFKGKLIVPLFNGGNETIPLRVGDSMFTVEFVRTASHASVSWVEVHGPLERIPSGAVGPQRRSTFGTLEEAVVELKADLRSLRSSFEGFNAGTNQRISISARWAAWAAVFTSVVAIAVAAASLLLE